MKKPTKILLVVTSIIVVGFLVVSSVIVNSLPGPTEIARTLKKKRPPHSGALPADSVTAKPGPPAAPTASALSEETPAAQESKRQEDEILLAFMDEDPADIRVCDQLGQGSIKGLKDLENAKFDQIFGDDARLDPLTEALRIPLRAVFQNEHVSALLRDVMTVRTNNLAPEEKSSFMAKIDFYGRAARMAADLYANKSAIEDLGDRALHLGLIARMAKLRPGLTETVLRGHCEDLQKSIALNDKIDIKSERKQMVQLIKEAGFTPQELDFDPDEYLDFKLSMEKDKIAFGLQSKEPK